MNRLVGTNSGRERKILAGESWMEFGLSSIAFTNWINKLDNNSVESQVHAVKMTTDGWPAPDWVRGSTSRIVAPVRRRKLVSCETGGRWRNLGKTDGSREPCLCFSLNSPDIPAFAGQSTHWEVPPPKPSPLPALPRRHANPKRQ